MPNYDYDRLIIGAGAVGLATTRAFALAGESVLLIDANEGFGMETSSRNSEVVHAGIYYPTGSLKAKLCAPSARAMHNYCDERGVALGRHGKLIVATDDNQAEALTRLKTQGDANGVDGLEIIDRARLKKVEPELHATAALYSPVTSVVDAHGYMAALEADAVNNGTTIAYQTRFVAARKTSHGFTAELNSQGEVTPITTSSIINCAGHGAREASLAIDGMAKNSIPPHYMAKGQYFTTTRKPPFRHLIYPLPNKGGLGIHLGLDTSGGTRFGPDIAWVDKADYAADGKHAEAFWQSISRYWPELQPHELVPAWAGVRPKTVPDSSSFQDFIIHDAEVHGCAGVIALYGIDSPGLTSSLALADYVAALARQH